MNNYISNIIMKYSNKIYKSDIRKLYKNVTIFSPLILDYILDGKCFVSKNLSSFLKKKDRYIMISDINITCKDTCFNLLHFPGHCLLLYISNNYFTIIDPSGTIRNFNKYIDIIKQEISLKYIEIPVVELQSITEDYNCASWSLLIGILICKFNLNPNEVLNNLSKDKYKLTLIIESFIIYFDNVLKDIGIHKIAEKLSLIKDDFVRKKIIVKGIKIYEKIELINKLIIDNDIDNVQKELNIVKRSIIDNPIWYSLPNNMHINHKTFLCGIYRYVDDNIFYKKISKINPNDDIKNIMDMFDCGEKFKQKFLDAYYIY